VDFRVWGRYSQMNDGACLARAKRSTRWEGLLFIAAALWTPVRLENGRAVLSRLLNTPPHTCHGIQH